VADGRSEDNSIIMFSVNTLETLELFRGDTVMVKGKRKKSTILIVLSDDDLDDGHARLNAVARGNLSVEAGDIVSVAPCPSIQYVRPILVVYLAILC
jgi:transitional endoplasmic reticulum ATPase